MLLRILVNGRITNKCLNVLNKNQLLMKGKVIVDLTHGEGNFLPKSSSYGGAVTVRFDK